MEAPSNNKPSSYHTGTWWSLTIIMYRINVLIDLLTSSLIIASPSLVSEEYVSLTLHDSDRVTV